MMYKEWWHVMVNMQAQASSICSTCVNWPLRQHLLNDGAIAGQHQLNKQTLHAPLPPAMYLHPCCMSYT